jgi:outer membrane protein OmpA-like peptidoglycan-associated protein
VAAKLGKCINYANCGTAYRNELVPAEAGAFVCPECGQPLKDRSSTGMKPPIWVLGAAGGAVALVLLGLVGWWMLGKRAPSPRPKDRSSSPDIVNTNPTPTPEPTAELNPPPTPSPPFPTGDNTGASVVSAPVSANPAAVAQERDEVRKEVLKRIDAMPNLSEENKNKLYTYVERAHAMTKLFTVQFNSGRPSLSAGDEDKIKQQSQSAEFQKIIGEPSTVFVILGYADKQGDEKANLKISQNRAQAVLDVLRDKCLVYNVMHVVGMGGSDLVDANKRDKNRVAEVWAVMP